VSAGTTDPATGADAVVREAAALFARGLADEGAARLAEAASRMSGGAAAEALLGWAERIPAEAGAGGHGPLTAGELTSRPAWRRLARALLGDGGAVERIALARPRRERGGRTASAFPWPDGEAARARAETAAREAGSGTARPPAKLRIDATAARPARRRIEALDALRALSREGGVRVVSSVEDEFAPRPGPGPGPIREPWIGFLHEPPGAPAWLPRERSAEAILAEPALRESLGACRGLFCFAEEHRRFLAANAPGTPVEALLLPATPARVPFTLERMRANPRPRLVQVGARLRRARGLSLLPLETLERAATRPLAVEPPMSAGDRAGPGPVSGSRVEVLPTLSPEAYDDLLAENVVLLDLHAAAGVRALSDCVARGTPVLVTPLPAVRELLGEGYPLYLSDRREAARRVEDPALVAAAHEHLLALPARGRLSIDALVAAVAASPIYRSL